MSTPANSSRLSVAIIVRDADEALRETLASICGIADEIVVADTGSSNPPRTLAAEFGARLFEHRWSDDFSAARNACLRRLTGDWVLWLDAGEVLSQADAQQLREFVIARGDASKAYLLLVTIPPNDFVGVTEQIARVRLVRRDPAIVFSGRVRESVGTALAEQGIQLQGLPYTIQRSKREHDPELKAARARRNLRLAELEIQERGSLPHLWNCLGDALQSLNENPRAADCFRQALALAPRGSSDMLEAYYGLITSLDGDAGNRETQLATCVKALEVFPTDAQLLCAMGGHLQIQGRADLSLQAYRTAFEFGQVNPLVWHVGEIREVAAVCCNLAMQLQNRDEEAQQVLEQALAACPGGTRARRHLIDLHVKHGRRDAALGQFEFLPKETPHREALRSAVRGACLAAQKNWIAAKAYLKTAYVAGCRDPLCLRWLTITLTASQESEEARNIILEWLRLDPQNGEALRFLRAAAPPSAGQADEGRQLRIDNATQEATPQSAMSATVRSPLGSHPVT